MENKIVFTIVDGRSGTHLIADTLVENIEVCYFNEINDFWKQVSPFFKN